MFTLRVTHKSLSLRLSKLIFDGNIEQKAINGAPTTNGNSTVTISRYTGYMLH